MSVVKKKKSRKMRATAGFGGKILTVEQFEERQRALDELEKRNMRPVPSINSVVVNLDDTDFTEEELELIEYAPEQFIHFEIPKGGKKDPKDRRFKKKTKRKKSDDSVLAFLNGEIDRLGNKFAEARANGVGGRKLLNVSSGLASRVNRAELSNFDKNVLLQKLNKICHL